MRKKNCQAKPSCQTMEQMREKIKKICGIAYVVLTVIGATYIIMALLDMSYEIMSLLDVSLNIPAFSFGFIGARGVANPVLVMLLMLLYHAIILSVMLYVRSVFKDLRDGGSPFSRKVSIAASGLSGALISIGIMQAELLLIFAAVLVGLFAYIFDYGRILQEDADHTL